MAVLALTALIGGDSETTTAPASSQVRDNPAYLASIGGVGDGDITGTVSILGLAFDFDYATYGPITQGSANGVTLPAGWVFRADVATTGQYVQIWTKLETGATPSTITISWPSGWLAGCHSFTEAYGLQPGFPGDPLIPIPAILYASAQSRAFDPPDTTLTAANPVFPDTTNEWVGVALAAGWGGAPGITAAAGYYDEAIGNTGDGGGLRYTAKAYDPGDPADAPTFGTTVYGICSVTLVVPNAAYTLPNLGGIYVDGAIHLS